jgi:hypothetical protein
LYNTAWRWQNKKIEEYVEGWEKQERQREAEGKAERDIMSMSVRQTKDLRRQIDEMHCFD